MTTSAPIIEPVLDTFMSKEEAALRYPGTPIWGVDNVPEGFAGAVHIGEGIFRAWCRECRQGFDSYGSVPRYAGIGRHEYDEHGLDVPGINVGLMATS